MEMKNIKNIRDILQKIGPLRLAVLVLAGIVLLVFSFPPGTEGSEEESSPQRELQGETLALDAMQKYARQQEKATEEILSRVEGIGRVKVMLTLAASEEKVPLQNEDITEDETNETDQTGGTRSQSGYQSKRESVIIQGEEEKPYVVQINSPRVEGVVVVAQGASSGNMKTEILEAIQALFPVEPHKIKIMKME